MTNVLHKVGFEFRLLALDVSQRMLVQLLGYGTVFQERQQLRLKRDQERVNGFLLLYIAERISSAV